MGWGCAASEELLKLHNNPSEPGPAVTEMPRKPGAQHREAVWWDEASRLQTAQKRVRKRSTVIS